MLQLEALELLKNKPSSKIQVGLSLSTVSTLPVEKYLTYERPRVNIGFFPTDFFLSHLRVKLKSLDENGLCNHKKWSPALLESFVQNVAGYVYSHTKWRYVIVQHLAQWPWTFLHFSDSIEHFFGWCAGVVWLIITWFSKKKKKERKQAGLSRKFIPSQQP